MTTTGNRRSSKLSLSQNEERRTRRKVCLVTREVFGRASLSDAGANLLGLAQQMAASGDSVTILWVPPVKIYQDYLGRKFSDAEAQLYNLYLVRLVMLGDVPELSPYIHSPEKASLAVYYYLKRQDFEEVHFSLEGGLAYYTIMAQELGLYQPNWSSLLLLHTPLAWSAQSNKTLPETLVDLAVYHMERYCAEFAPHVAFFSKAMRKWCKSQGWKLTGQSVELPVITPTELNPRSPLAARAKGQQSVVEFGIWPGWEMQRGLTLICDALDRVAAAGHSNLVLNFFGPFSRLLGEHTGGLVVRRARQWPFSVRFLPRLTERESLDFLRARGGVVLLPDLDASGGRMLFSCAATGTPVIATAVGANVEVSQHSLRDDMPAANSNDLATAIIAALSRAPVPIAAVLSQSDSEKLWESERKRLRQALEAAPAPKTSVTPRDSLPTVSIIMAHYERPQFLEDAIRSVEAQTYPEIELILVDDGSKKTETLSYLKSLEQRFKKRRWKIIRQKNSYLGAARNTGIKAASGTYILFLDDDNALLPGAIEIYIRALETSKSDICTSVSKIFLGPHIPSDPELGLIEYFPLGGSLDLALFHNSFGDANAIMRREVFEKVGYLAEDYGFVASDWEFFARAAMKGLKVRIIPEATYWYRSSAQGMFRSAHWYETREPILRLFRENGYAGLSDIYKLAVAQNTHESEIQGYHFRLRYDLANKPFEELDALEPDSAVALEKLAQIAAAEGQTEAAMSLLGQMHDGGLLRRVMEAWSQPSLAEMSVAREPLSPAEEIILDQDKLREITIASSDTQSEPPLSFVEAPDSLFIKTAPPHLVVATLSAGIPAGFVSVSFLASLEEFGARSVEIMLTVMDINITHSDSLPATEAKKLIIGTSGWKTLSRPFFKAPITVVLDKPSHTGGTLHIMIRHTAPVETTDTCLVAIRRLTYQVYRGLGPARRPRLGLPANFSKARQLSPDDIKSARLATPYVSREPLPLFKNGERGFQLLAEPGSVTVAVMQWAFPPFAKGIVASAELLSDDAGAVEISIGLARPTHLGSWTSEGPVESLAFSGWRRISRSFELQDVELTIPESMRHHLAICAAVRVAAGASPPNAITFWRQFAIRW